MKTFTIVSLIILGIIALNIWYVKKFGDDKNEP